MPESRPLLGNPRNVLIVRPLPGLGDLLCIVPALRALRGALPGARITLLGLPAAAWLLERFPDYVDELLHFPGWPGIPGTAADLDARVVPDFITRVQRRRFDLVLQWQGSGTLSNPLSVLLAAGAPVTGFFLPAQHCPDPERFLPWRAHESEIRRFLRLLEHLGVAPRGEHLEFPLRPDDGRELARLDLRLAPQSYVCVVPGASAPGRRWPAERFAAAGDALATRGLRVVLVGGPEEQTVAAEVGAAMTAPHVNLAGRTGLGALAALVADAALVLCNDSGSSHLAAALRTPSVVVFRCTDPQRWAPLDGRLHRVVGLDEPLVTEQLRQPGHARCLAEGCAQWRFDVDELPPFRLTTEQVLAAADAQLLGS